MGINVRTKGAGGERQIADDLNLVINMARLKLGLPVPATPTVQRNQQQSAVGGCDLIGTFGLAIEVKRQENLSIGSWWKQCVASATTLGEIPVLLFRQNNLKWRCIVWTQLELPARPPSARFALVRSEISYDDFKAYFARIVEYELSSQLPVSSKNQSLFE